MSYMIKATNAIVLSVIVDNKAPLIKGEAYLTKTGAKLYSKGGGWWFLSGYHYALEDELITMKAMSSLGATINETIYNQMK